MTAFRIVRDARGALVHVRTPSGECIGCIEVGLFEIVKQVIEEERAVCAQGEGIPGRAPAARSRRSTGFSGCRSGGRA